MRNLRVNHRSLLETPPGLKLTATAVDVDSDSVICAFGPTIADSLLELKRWRNNENDLQPIASWDAPSPSLDLTCDEILKLHFFPDALTACLVLAGGDIVIVREEPKVGEEKIEIVGSVDVGISAAAWSPDEELLAISTRAATLLYMTRDFHNVTDIVFTSDDLNASSHVSVGWGKKETQFKGKKARALRDPTMPETVDEGILSEHDSKETTISWRGDGAYVAVNSIESDSRRVIRVYSRDGILDSASEPVDGLVGALSWRPAGNLLASIQYRDTLARVVFFERNGLRHGQFDLRLSREELTDWGRNVALVWNIDSTVLAVCFKDRVQLWTMGNYHYYLKQEIFGLSEKPAEKPISLTWHLEKPLRFVLSSESGVQKFTYSSTICGGSTAWPHDYGIVAVIDGKCLKVTPLRLTNIPPPMALHEITLQSNITDVSIALNSYEPDSIMIAVLHREGCSLFEWPISTLSREPPAWKWSVDAIQNGKNPVLMYLQVAFSAESGESKPIVLLSNHASASTLSMLNKNGLTLGEVSSRGNDIKGIVIDGPGTISGTYFSVDGTKDIRREDIDSDLTYVNGKNGLELAAAPFEIASAESIRCGTSKTDTVKRSTGFNDKIFSLADNGFLFANQRCLARNCTSFLVTPAHLIYTTTQHVLKFVHMTDVVEELEIPPDTPETDERCRSIERGAKLVTVMPSIFALVMQMPRGNLETIYPRALVLAGIRDSIDRKKYRKAFLACRNHRVDMNILHDYAPRRFISSVGLFLDQLKKVEYIDLFLSQLREEDVSKTMYTSTVRLHNQSRSEEHIREDAPASKVNRICDAFLVALEDRISTHFQNVVTAHVCKIPPDLDAGLSQIAHLRNTNKELVDSAVEHICFLADVNRLYDHALGIYDLRLALLVAQQSQKDPKEYLPFLQNLQKESSLRMRYLIDDYLGRHRKALKHLCKLNAFDEVKNYTVRHDLYSEALEYYRYRDDQLKEIVRLYAAYLQQSRRFKEAGIAYEYLNDYTPASEAFKQAHLWKESLACATLIPLPPSQLQPLCQSLADSLSESKDFFSAATILLDYLSDVPTATRLFCKGYFFADALRTAGLHNRPDLLTSIVDVGLIEGMASMTELLADCKSQLNAQIPRLRELRTKKAEDPLSFFEGDVNEGADIPDDVSLAPTDASTTGGSLFTRYTNRSGTVGTNATRKSSKNRRKEERKKARGKKGSIYEEEYLVNSVGRLVDRVNAVGDEVERLVVGLMRRGMRERAGAVENAMVEVVELCMGCIKEVFQEGVIELKVELKGENEEGRPKGGEGVMWDTLEGGKRREAPVVKEFARLSLLGR